MPYKIGVFGSAEDISEVAVAKAKALGKILGQQGCIVLGGASTGVPYEVAVVARQHGSKVWGFSPANDLVEQKKLAPGQDLSVYDKLIYVPTSFSLSDDVRVRRKYRNVVSTATCDAGLIISGRWGTLNEFTNMHDMGKVIGVLTGTGGVADELASLCQKINKKSGAEVIFDDSPEKLVEEVIKTLDKRK